MGGGGGVSEGVGRADGVIGEGGSFDAPISGPVKKGGGGRKRKDASAAEGGVVGKKREGGGGGRGKGKEVLDTVAEVGHIGKGSEPSPDSREGWPGLGVGQPLSEEGVLPEAGNKGPELSGHGGVGGVFVARKRSQLPKRRKIHAPMEGAGEGLDGV